MNIALINPNWTFDGSIYFGCREPHLPLEYGYAKALLERDGHHVVLIDAFLENLSLGDVREILIAFRPDLTVVTTAPSYLFWRCAPPELRVPQDILRTIRDVAGVTGVVGPHGSTTPASTLRKLRADAVVLGECEETLRLVASGADWSAIPSLCYWQSHEPVVQGAPASCDLEALPSLQWPPETILRHAHHHHRFDAPPQGPGAEMEVSRGCPYHCTFCAKDNFRDRYRKRPLETILQELDLLLKQGVEYVYFIDEIFLPDQPLLEAFAERNFKFGLQTRIDLWKPALLDLLGRAGCVSIEAGVESITTEGRALLDKNCRLSSDELSERLIYAKRTVPFVQANLLQSPADDVAAVQQFRSRLNREGIWCNDPVPLFPYPGSPEYTQRWGLPDEHAWERAVDFYLSTYSNFSDIQEARPLPLEELERAPSA
jgi:anaerobic magnesium-protoporphyrin IX monomethyl ester cyclase